MNNFVTNRRKFLVGAQALAASAMVPGLIGGAARAQNLAKVTYLTPFGYLISFIETMYADVGGIYAKHGLNVTIEGGRGSSMAVQQVTAGNALISRTGGTDLIKAYATDPSIVSVGEIYQSDIFFVISSKDAPITKPEDMVGKTMGIVSASGATENILDMMLAARDVPKANVAREVVGNAPAAFGLVKQGRIAGFIATSDTVFQLNVDKQPVVAWSTDDVAPCPGQVYMTSKAQLEKSGDLIGKFLASVEETLGVLLASKDLAPIVDQVTAKYDVFEAKRPDKGLAVLKHTLAKYEAPYKDKLASSKDHWKSAYDLMLKAGLISATADQNFHDDSARKLAFG
ncbi:MAG: ABC transporter substrate-binding protein [Rhizobiaceae bacterium]|mgnify:FL=1|nr:ABC transporter substrate-binding protein [Hyphomicrobiales bacterium]